jgi:hypothetical protein
MRAAVASVSVPRSITELTARTVVSNVSPSPSRKAPRCTLSCLDGTQALRPSGAITGAPR